MRRIVALVASALLATPVLAQSNGNTVQAAAKARNAAMVAGDSKGWGKYTTDDFMVTGADGVMKTKQQRMTEIEGHPLSARPEARDEQWRAYGNTAIHTVLQPTSDSTAQRITTVWVKQKGAWKVAAVQVTRVASGTP